MVSVIVLNKFTTSLLIVCLYSTHHIRNFSL